MASLWLGNERRWVKEGSTVGHFIIQEIKPRAIIYRNVNSEQMCEISLQSGPDQNAIARRRVPELAHAHPSVTLDSAASDNAHTASDN